MGTFTFDSGFTPTPTNKGSRAGKRETKSIFDAPCSCFDMGLTCQHTVKERSASLGDSTTPAATATLEWMSHFEVLRNQNTQRYNAGKV